METEIDSGELSELEKVGGYEETVSAAKMVMRARYVKKSHQNSRPV